MSTEQAQTTLRDTLASNIEAAEAGVLESVETVAARARDEGGRFATPDKAVDPKPKEAVAPDPAPAVVTEPAAAAPRADRPTTWKKDYLPMWDKLATGQPLTADESTKLAAYYTQRENEYKSGVSTYKTEALAAREVQEAIAPFLPELQAHGVTPRQWISDVGNAHKLLVSGSPQEKLQMFTALAQRYGVPLAAVSAQQQPGGNPPIVMELMGQIQALKSELEKKLTGISSWKDQMDTAAMQAEVQRLSGDPEKYPHFEAVREQMAQYLETGAARDLDSAYKMACRMDDTLMEEELNQRIAKSQQSQQQVVAQAKAKAVSPKSATPGGAQGGKADAKDRRSVLSEQFDSLGGGRV